METIYLLAGGDRRQFWLSRLLLRRGRVFTRAVPGLEDRLPERPADVLILPTPCLDRAGLLRTAGEGLDPEELAGYYDERTRIYGGALPAALAARLPGCGTVTDLLADPAVAAVNATVPPGQPACGPCCRTGWQLWSDRQRPRCCSGRSP